MITTYHSLFEICGQQTWKMPQLTGLNKLPPHSSHFPYPTQDEAYRNDYLSSRWFLNLNGDWDFKIASRPEQAMNEFI